MSLAVTVLPITVVPAAAATSRIPIDWSLGERIRPAVRNVAFVAGSRCSRSRLRWPRLTSIPFWATPVVGPAPVTVFPVIVPVEPVPRTTMPVFW